MKAEVILQIFKYVNEDGSVDLKELLKWLESNKLRKKEEREVKFNDGDISHSVVYEGDGWEVGVHYLEKSDGTLKLWSLDIS